MGISQRGGFTGETRTLPISSLDALCAENSVFLALSSQSCSWYHQSVFQGGFGGGSHVEPGPRSSPTLACRCTVSVTVNQWCNGHAWSIRRFSRTAS
jgi:hypothetical protein